MTALAVIQVAGFAGVEVSAGIVTHLAVNVTVLEIGVGVAFFAAVVIGSRKVINATAGF